MPSARTIAGALLGVVQREAGRTGKLPAYRCERATVQLAALRAAFPEETLIEKSEMLARSELSAHAPAYAAQARSEEHGG